MARWCVATGYPPSEWKALRADERAAITTAHNDAAAEIRASIRTR